MEVLVCSETSERPSILSTFNVAARVIHVAIHKLFRIRQTKILFSDQ